MDVGDLVKVSRGIGEYFDEIGIITYVHKRSWAPTDLYEILWRGESHLVDGSILRSINEAG